MYIIQCVGKEGNTPGDCSGARVAASLKLNSHLIDEISTPL